MTTNDDNLWNKIYNKNSEMTKSSNSLSDLHLNVLTDDEIEWEVEEVRIKVPQGIIAAKFWGPKVRLIKINIVDHFVL